MEIDELFEPQVMDITINVKIRDYGQTKFIERVVLNDLIEIDVSGRQIPLVRLGDLLGEVL